MLRHAARHVRSNARIDRAIASVLEPLERRTLLSVAVSGIPSWTEQGPGPTFGGSGQGIPNQPVSGAIEAVAVHPDDANIIWIGSVNGGIWKTTDGGTTWFPKTDQFPTLSISALSIDPNNPNTLWAGTARTTSGGAIGGTAGGLFKSTDGGDTWVVYPAGLIGGTLGVHAVLPTKIAQGSGHLVLVGTDQNLNMGGLLRSTDGGTGNFDRISGIADDGEDNDLDNLIDAADPSEQNGLPAGTVDSIVTDPANANRIYVGMRGKGVFVTDNGGATWTPTPNLESVVGANSSNFAKIQHTIRVHLALSAASATTGNRPVYAATIVTVQDSLFEAVPSSGERKQIVVSPNTLIEPGDFIELEKSPTLRERIRVVSRTFGNNVWTLTLEKGLTNSYPLNSPVRCFRYDGSSQERVSGVFRTDDNGANWAFMGIPGDIDGGISPVGQADKHFSMLADKDDPNIVYLGGDTQPGPHPNSSGGVHNSGRLFQATFNPSNNGTTWQPIAASGANGTAPHPDSRAMVMDKFGDIIQVDDGGIYKLSLAGTAFQRWVSLNGDLRLMEFNSVASSNGLILGGAQDNGVALQSTLGGVLWNRLTSGDGQIVRAAGSSQLYSFQNLGGFKINGHSPALNVMGTGKKLNDVDKIRFNEPYVLNAVDPTRMLIGQARLFESVTLATVPLGDLLMPLGSGNAAVVGSIFPNAMVYGGWEGAGSPRPDIGWIGTRENSGQSNGQHTLYVRQSGMYGAFVPVDSWAAGSVVAIDVDPTNWREVFLLDGGGNIWHSASGGEKPNEVGKWKWSQLNDINTLVDVAGTSQFSDIDVARKGDKRVILVSGLAGVFRRIETLESGVWIPGPWTRFGGGPIVHGVADPFGGGLPNTQVTELHLPNDPSVYTSATPGPDDRILVGTHGRSAFTATIGDELFQEATVSIASGAGNQMITLRREAARPWVLDIFEYAVGSPEPSIPTRRLPLASIQEIFIDAGAGNDQITVDYTNGAIYVPNGIAISGGDDSDSLKIVHTGLEILPDRKLETVGSQQVSTITTYDAFAQQGVQRVIWDASIETPPPAAQLLTTNGVDVIRVGLQGSSNSLRRGTEDSLADKKIAGLDARSLAGAVGGRRVTPKHPEPDLGDEGAVTGPDPASQVNSATSILARLLEEGLHGFSISDIGSSGRINSLTSLREALDALDAITGNVTLDTTKDLDADGTLDTQFTVQIVDRAFGGLVNLDVNANTALGDVSLSGNAEFDARVDLNIVFGIDGRGFFVKPSAAGTPAIRISDVKIDGELGGTGRFGFLGVDLNDGALTVDPDVSIEMSFVDPGTDAADETIRFPEMFPSDYATLLKVNVKGDPGDGAGNEDVVLDGTFGVSAVLGGDRAPLFSADAKLSFADLADPTSLTFTPDANGTLSSLFGIDATTFLNDVLGAAEQIKQTTGVDVFAENIPVLDRSLDDILGGSVEETFTDAQFLQISSVFAEDGYNKFRVTLNDINPLERGIAVGNAIKFTGTDDVIYDGEIDAVDFASFTVKFDQANTIAPQTGTGASIKVTRQGSTRDMIESWLGELANPVGLSARVPTIQDMIAALGVDAAGVKLSAANDAIEIPLAFALDPITFSHKLDLGTTIAGLQLSAAGNVDVEIAPAFKFSMGVRFTSGVPVAERIYLKEDDDAEVTLGLKVTVDDPTASGRIGFLDVALSEDTPNDGIEFLGTIKLNLLDTVGGDGRIIISELEAGDLLNSFETDISADFLINPLKIVATVGDSTELGKITIKLDAADGHIASLADLQNLPSKIQVTGESNFSNFQNITPEMILAALRALIERLRDMGAGGVLDRKLPVIDKSISDLFNVADKLAEDLGVLEGNDFSSASKLQAFLQGQLGNAVTVTVGSDSIQFRLNFAKNVVESLPFSLNLGDTWGLFKVDANGNILFTADATADVSFGVLTGSNLDLADRVYFDTAGDDASKVTITGSANLGYDGGNGFDAHVKLGFFDFDVVGARAFLDAELVGALIDPDDAGRLTFREITDKVVAGDVTDVFDGNFTGRVQARVPLDGDGNGVDASGSGGTPGSSSGDALIEVAGLLENLGNVAFDDPNLHADDVDPLTANQLDPTRLLVYTHNLDNLIANAVLNFDNLIEGLEKLIEWGDKLLGIGVLDFDLPFTGASLRDAINFFKDPSGPFATIIAAINGSGGLGDNPSDSSAMLAAQDINDALAALSGLSPVLPGGDILKFQHLNNDVTQPLVGATFKFRLSVPFNLPLANPKFDLGLDFFDMNADVALGVSGFVDLLVGLGIDKAHGGFYLITEFPELAVDEPELSLRQLRITANGNASVDVGFLEMGATFDPLKNFLQTNLRINLNGLDDDRLTFSELADFSNLTAIVDRIPGAPGLEGLDLNVSARVDVPLTVANNPDLPSMSTNFVMQWGPFTLDDIRGGTPAFTTPLVELRDVRLNPGEFIDRYAMPFLQTLDRYNVLAPVIDKLDDPLPIIGGTLFDLLVTNNLALTQQQRDTATFLFNIAKTVSDFDAQIDDASGLTLNFGDVAIRPDRTLDTSNADPTGQADDTTPAPQQFPGDHLPFVGDLIRDLGEIGVTFPMLNVGSLVQLFMGNTTDLIFADLPELHVGKEFFEKIPIYSVGIPYIASATINAVFGGSIDLYVNLAAGLDSSGISRGLSHVLEGLYVGDFAPGDDHQITPGDEERPEVWLEASVSAGINARASLLGFDVLSVTGKASIGGAVGLDLNDDNDLIRDPFDLRDDAARADGKFYLGEIEAVIDSTGGEVFCMFDVVGEVFAKLAFEISVPYAPNPDWSHRWTLVKFDIECEPSPPLTPDFADVIGTSLVFTSSIGASHGDLHSRAATNHADGDAIEVFLVDKNGNADDGDETLRIRKNGFTEDFGPLEGGNNHLDDISELTLITDEGDGSLKFKMTDFGAGPDNVLIDQAIRIPVRLAGGGDNDTLTAGDGGGTLFGGDGDDYLSLAAPPTGLSDSQRLSRSAFFDGGAGSDQIFGGVGNDTVLGGEGNDTVDGGGSGDGADSGNDTLVGGGGDDVLDGRGGVDRVIGDYDQSRYPRPASGAEEGADFLAGGGAGDILWGDNRGTSDSADGPAPDPSRATLTGDFIYGGDGSDLVFGGAGNDQIQVGPAGPIASIPNRAFGGTGNDAITGGTGRDSLVGNAGDDLVDGAGDNDLLYAGDDTFGPNLSNQGFDRLIGGAGFDLLDGSDANSVTAAGDAGTDSVIGSRGADDLQGGDERDFILAGPGNDLATGGAGDDDILGGDGTVGSLTVDFSESDGADSIAGDAGNDVLLGDNGTVNNSTRATATTESGGTGADTVTGAAGNDSILGGGAGDRLDGGTEADLIFGDFGTIDPALASNVNFTSANTQATSGGDDVITGGTANDTAIGGQGADQISGGDGDDDLIGGHNVPGGRDGADAIDGDAGNDAIAGDNAAIVRRSDSQSRNSRALAGATLYNAAGAPNVTGAFQVNLDGGVGRDITLYDHTAATAATLFGADNLAGGVGHDSVFGQLGNDRLQGDGATALNVSATQPSANTANDGNDYAEGGGGDDVMFGNSGQDDLIGGSSNLFGLGDGSRPDGADVIFGGAGDAMARNALGDTTPGGHARDADVILGDNGNVFRIVSADGASTYKTFNYDNYSGGVRIVPRAVALLDYSADGTGANDLGAGDHLHGEAGDDSIHGMSGNDFLTGDGQDDHLLGESGDDWLSGGAGDDGMIGDDGKIITSRNGMTEPLYGITAATSQQVIEVKSLQMVATINVVGLLKHEVDLEPFTIGGADVMYGGLGNDAVHGGAGQDLMSGAEALPAFYLPAVIPTLTFNNGKFDVFSFTTPMARITDHPLNFDGGTPGNVIRDGNDVLFGDAGNDWLVGGTDTDRLYGGYGDDVHNTDDDLETAGGANTSPDAAPYAGADYAFGGAGRDVQIGNAPEDRLIDWVGEFNGYYVPFSQFGQSTVVRQISSQLVDFLYQLSRSDGADRTRVGSGLGTAARNGEPFGELGLVIQQDPDWLAQNGPPIGPQPQ